LNVNEVLQEFERFEREFESESVKESTLKLLRAHLNYLLGLHKAAYNNLEVFVAENPGSPLLVKAYNLMAKISSRRLNLNNVRRFNKLQSTAVASISYKDGKTRNLKEAKVCIQQAKCLLPFVGSTSRDEAFDLLGKALKVSSA